MAKARPGGPLRGCRRAVILQYGSRAMALSLRGANFRADERAAV